MIEAIADLGKYFLSEHPDISVLDQVLDNAYDGGRNKHLFVIVFKKEKIDDNGELKVKWKYKNIEYEVLDNSHKNKILYKRGSARGTDFTPTTKITDDLENKTFPNKIYNWFKQNKDNEFFSDEEKEFLNEIYDSIEKRESDIIRDIKEKMDEISDEYGEVLTVGFEDEYGNIKYCSNYSFFKKFILQETIEKYRYSKTFKKFSYSKNKICGVCNKKKEEVFGYYTDLKFYNVDKPGMITGGFQCEGAWKNYPVCNECALNIKNGYNFLKENFNFRFYGLRYYFIPNVNEQQTYNEILDRLLEYEKNPKFKTENIKRLSNDENELFEFLKEEKTNLSFNLFFYDQPQKDVLRILLIIDDILPSRLQTIFSVKQFVDKIIFFKDAKSKKDEPLCYFNFGIVRNFFPNTKIEGNKDKSFLEITEKIFKDKIIDNIYIIQNIMQKIRNDFANERSTWLNTLKGFMFIFYILQLKVINIHQEVDMDKQFFEEFKIRTREELGDKIELFFNSFKNFFLTDAHKGIFLLGVLTQFLLNIQQNERGATPFRSKLKGLKMSAYDLSVLLPEIIEKLEQYKANYYLSLEEIISKYMISAGNYNSWRLPVDEMNFIFVLGMNLSRYFKIQFETEEE